MIRELLWSYILHVLRFLVDITEYRYCLYAQSLCRSDDSRCDLSTVRDEYFVKIGHSGQEKKRCKEREKIMKKGNWPKYRNKETVLRRSTLAQRKRIRLIT